MSLYWVMSATALAFLASSCQSSQEPTAEDEVQAAFDRILCQAVSSYDADCDGVHDDFDQVPDRPDYGDDDGDLVFNSLDKYPGFDDMQFDSDGDGIKDFLDNYHGNNYADDDSDGIPNAIDSLPITPLPIGQAPQAQDTRALGEQIVLDSMRRDMMRDLINRDSDTDVDGIPDSVDTTPDQYTNDRDGDGSPDFYDPDPGNPWESEYYNPYNPSQDEYYDDPYDPTSDAYYDDDSNGWGD